MKTRGTFVKADAVMLNRRASAFCSALVSDIGSIFNLAAIVVGGGTQFKALVSLKPSERQSASIFLTLLHPLPLYPHPQLLLKGVKCNEMSRSCWKRKNERLVTYIVAELKYNVTHEKAVVIFLVQFSSMFCLGHPVVNHVTL
jgi:hypothetical protein